MSKTIPVLSCNIIHTFRWLQEKYSKEIDKLVLTQHTIYLKDGTRLMIVTEIRHILSMEFSSYLVSPNYTDLEKEAQYRIARFNTKKIK